MTPEELKDIRWFKSKPLPLEFDSSRTDRENGVLHDVVMIEEGPAKGHDMHLEAEFVEDLVAYDQKHYSKRGLKNRFDHPGASEGTMGTQMGYFRNVRLRDKGGKKQAIADLHLLDASDLSPTKPNMKQWMLRMSEEAPDFVMQSIVFKPGRYYQRDDKGKKKYVWEYENVTDKSGNSYPRWISEDASLGKVFVEFGSKGEHYYTDTVEAGAATDALFSTDANPHLFVSKALSWLDEHPELKQFALKHPEKVQEFLHSLGIKPKPQNQKYTMSSLKELLFGKEKPTEEVALSAEQVQELRNKLTQAEAALSDAQNNFGKAQEKVKQLEKSLADKTTELQTAQARVKELEDRAAATHDLGKRETDDGKEEKKASWLSSPANSKAQEAYARMNPAKKEAAA